MPESQETIEETLDAVAREISPDEVTKHMVGCMITDVHNLLDPTGEHEHIMVIDLNANKRAVLQYSKVAILEYAEPPTLN